MYYNITKGKGLECGANISDTKWYILYLVSMVPNNGLTRDCRTYIITEENWIIWRIY